MSRLMTRQAAAGNVDGIGVNPFAALPRDIVLCTYFFTVRSLPPLATALALLVLTLLVRFRFSRSRSFHLLVLCARPTRPVFSRTPRVVLFVGEKRSSLSASSVAFAVPSASYVDAQ